MFSSTCVFALLFWGAEFPGLGLQLASRFLSEHLGCCLFEFSGTAGFHEISCYIQQRSKKNGWKFQTGSCANLALRHGLPENLDLEEAQNSVNGIGTG